MRNSKRRQKPTRSCQTVVSAAATTSSVTRVSTRQWVAAVFRAAVFRTSSVTFSATYLAAVEAGADRGRSAAPICVTPSRFLWKKPSEAQLPRSGCPHYSTVILVTAAVQNLAVAPLPVVGVAAAVRSDRSRDFFRFSRPVPSVGGGAKRSRILAASVEDRVWSKKPRPSRSKYRRVSTRAIGSA